MPGLTFFYAGDDVVDIGEEEIAAGCCPRQRVKRQNLSIIGVEWLPFGKNCELVLRGHLTNLIVLLAGPLYMVVPSCSRGDFDVGDMIFQC